MRQEYPVQQSTKFQVGDQVLYDDSPNYHTKLEKKWVGLWTIIEVLYNRTYKVADHMGVRKQPINRDHLKRYYERTELREVIKLKMSKRKANQHVSKIIADLLEGRYSLKRVLEGERDPFRLCRIKKLFKKLRRAKGELIEDRIILFFELGKELGNDKIYVGEKNDRLCARRVYKSFEKSYP